MRQNVLFSVLLRFTIVPVFVTIFCTNLFAATQDKKGTETVTHFGLPETRVSYQWFLSYINGDKDGKNVNEFALRRGYISITSRFNDWLSTKVVPDITMDRDGNGRGDLKMRLKYCFIQFHAPEAVFFTKPSLAFGIVSRPWLDYEQKFNLYRSQGSMFLERGGVFGSPDYGVLFETTLGGEIDESYRKEVNSYYPGRYGTIAMGIFNGGGYSAVEENQNKIFESRLTLRPLPDIVPGLQFSYVMLRGKGNTASSPDWSIDLGAIQHEHKWHVLIAQLYRGKGNAGGSALLPGGASAPQEGYSLFGELKFPRTRWGLIGRYDYFDFNRDTSNSSSERYIAGLVYHIYGKTKLILDVDTVEFEDTRERETIGKLTVEVNF